MPRFVCACTRRFAISIVRLELDDRVVVSTRIHLAVEFGAFPHEQGIIDKLWEQSAIR
jgi:hypothetical protein